MVKALISFQYKRNAAGEFFPVIPLAIHYKKKRVEVYALVDSGATTSIFRPEVAEQLGIKIEKGKELYLTGVGGRIKGFLHKLEIEVGGKEFACPIIFSYEFTISFSVLGGEEFFRRFQIIFDERKKIVKLE
jgi:hypothetical protein